MLPPGFRLIPAWCPLTLDAFAAVPWQQPTLRIYGRSVLTPRLTCWFGEAAYTYSGKRNEPLAMPAWLDSVRRDLERLTGARFNSALLNLYRGGSDSVAWHADDEPELGSEPTIASLSIGAARAFAVRENGGPGRWRLMLGGGDLLVMSGRSQRDYQHAVPKTARGVGPRINLTFHWIHE